MYPVVATVKRSFYDRSGDNFIGFDNYHALFTTPSIRTAIENNAIWVAVVPALVTAIGLVFAVLTERVSWAVAFKTAVFMPMAVSLFAAGVIWHVMDQKDPNQGAVNAARRRRARHDLAAGHALGRLAVGPEDDGHAEHGHLRSRRRCGRARPRCSR